MSESELKWYKPWEYGPGHPWFYISAALCGIGGGVLLFLLIMAVVGPFV